MIRSTSRSEPSSSRERLSSSRLYVVDGRSLLGAYKLTEVPLRCSNYRLSPLTSPRRRHHFPSVDNRINYHTPSTFFDNPINPIDQISTFLCHSSLVWAWVAPS